jgi:hypothetical protein
VSHAEFLARIQHDLLADEPNQAVERLADTFAAKGIRYAVVGGLATAQSIGYNTQLAMGNWWMDRSAAPGEIRIMPETVLEQHYRDRLLSLQRIAVPQQGHTAMTGWYFEDLVTLCLELSASGQQLLEREYQLIFQVPDLSVAWLQERRQAIEELTAKYLELAASLKSLARLVTDSARGKDQVDRLDQAVQCFAAAKQRVLERWPVGNAQEVAQARAAGRPEDYLDLDEAFAQIAGVDVETWRQRVEKRTRQA